MRRSLLALPLALSLAIPGFAANAADPPGRVGRLSYIDGTVSFHPPGDQSGDWAPATLNYPVTTGESFWTDANAKAELQIGPAELRLDQASQLDITQLDDRSLDMQLDQGDLNLHLAQMPSGEVKIMTPRGRVVITAAGTYDIDAGQPNGDQSSDQVEVSVLQGAARFDADQGAVDIGANQAAIVSGQPMNVQLVAAQPTDFDNWAQNQVQQEAAAQQPRYVPAAVTGYQDLDHYGDWAQDPTYGEIWYPNDLPSDWAPYRDGHWAWIAPWGWTWIDDAPWGFAPFHYGRWVDIGDRWAWTPDDIAPQPVYAPALVSFIGGDGWGVDLAGGAAVAAIGWVALAPHEEYHPWFHASQAWARNANGRDWNARAYNANSAAVSNFHNRQAATVVPAAAFANAAPVQRASVAVDPSELAHARTARTLNGIRPTALARIGHADPAAASAVVPQANAQAHIAHGRVNAATPASLAAIKPATAPRPHPVASAANEQRPRNANAAASNNASAGNSGASASSNSAAGAAAANQAQPRTQRTNERAAANAPANAPANASNEHPREAGRSTAPAASASSALAPHPAPPNRAVAEHGPATARPNAAPNNATAAARPEPARPNQAPHQAAEPQRVENASRPTAPAQPAAPQVAHAPAAAPQVAHAPAAAPHPAVAQAAHAPAAAPHPAPQVAHAPAAAPHPAPQVAHAPAAAPHPAPQVAHAPAAVPHPTPQVAHAPAAAPHPAPQVAHAPAAVPHPTPQVAHAPAAAPHPAPAPRPQVAAAPAAAPHPAPAPHPAAPPPAAHPAAAPAPHPAAPAKAAPAAPEKKPPG